MQGGPEGRAGQGDRDMVSELLAGVIFFVLGFAARGVLGGKDGVAEVDTGKMASDLAEAVETVVKPFHWPDFEFHPGHGDRNDNNFHGDQADDGRLRCISGALGEAGTQEESQEGEAFARYKTQKFRRKSPPNKLWRISGAGEEALRVVARTPNEARVIAMTVLGWKAEKAALLEVKEEATAGPLGY